MPGLDRSIVEHRLPIKSGFWPRQQPARRCNPNILPHIKAEVTKLIEAKFISAMLVCRVDLQCRSSLQEKWEASCLH